MLKFDFSTYMDQKIDFDNNKCNELKKRLEQDEMAGFYHHVIKKEELEKIKQIALEIREKSEVFIIIGIGGSFMGSYALKNIFRPSYQKQEVEIVYLGTDLSSSYLSYVLDLIKRKDVCINVISKSGTTMEVSLVYQKVKEELEKKYSKEELQQRIIITTDPEKGLLRKEVNEEGYSSFTIPSNIGGRYSLMSPAHLLPLEVMGLDTLSLLEGYQQGLSLIEDAFYYASLRVELFNNKKIIENFSIYEPSLYYYTEWIKQLFGESEGKNQKGIFPISTVNTRDLHSLGQFIQDGNPILFETVIQVIREEDLVIGNLSLNQMNDIVLKSVCKAHYQEKTPSIMITLEKLDLSHIGMLSAFLMLAASFSAYLFGVDPFNQPGVEKYKREVKKNLENLKK